MTDYNNNIRFSVHRYLLAVENLSSVLKQSLQILDESMQRLPDAANRLELQRTIDRIKKYLSAVEKTSVCGKEDNDEG